jgi:hypothetical protein
MSCNKRKNVEKIGKIPNSDGLLLLSDSKAVSDVLFVCSDHNLPHLLQLPLQVISLRLGQET